LQHLNLLTGIACSTNMLANAKATMDAARDKGVLICHCPITCEQQQQQGCSQSASNSRRFGTLSSSRHLVSIMLSPMTQQQQQQQRFGALALLHDDVCSSCCNIRTARRAFLCTAVCLSSAAGQTQHQFTAHVCSAYTEAAIVVMLQMMMDQHVLVLHLAYSHSMLLTCSAAA
jgi:hypothetical protein